MGGSKDTLSDYEGYKPWWVDYDGDIEEKKI